MLLQNRTISMILTIPQVKELISVEKKSYSFKPPSIPVYHGSIISIEKNLDNENTSDLIVRVPNFHHVSLPVVTVVTTDDQLNETESQRDVRIKQPAPVRNDLNINQPEVHSRLSNAKRLAIGLRNLSRAFKAKQSANMNQIAFIPVVPDVEVITEKFQVPTIEKEKPKIQNSASKFLTPKILFIKRKHFKIKKKQQSTNSIDTEENTNNDLKDNQTEQENESIEVNHVNSSVEQQSTTIAQLIPNIPISIVDPESSSTHPYSTISGLPPDHRTITTDNDIPQPNTFISNARIDFRTNIQTIDQEPIQHYDDNFEESVYVVHPNGDTYSESYEITYELDPEYQRFLEHNKEQIYLSEVKDQPSVKFNLDQYEYEDLASTFTNWLPTFPPNTYEQVERESTDQIPQENPIPSQQVPTIKLPSLEDLSQTSNDQTSSVSAFSSAHDPDDTPMVNEDYTVILQFLKHALQIDTTSTNDDYNEFNKQLEQLFETNKINELE